MSPYYSIPQTYAFDSLRLTHYNSLALLFIVQGISVLITTMCSTQ